MLYQPIKTLNWNKSDVGLFSHEKIVKVYLNALLNKVFDCDNSLCGTKGSTNCLDAFTIYYCLKKTGQEADFADEERRENTFKNLLFLLFLLQ